MVTIQEILLERGRRAADARRQQGANTAQLFSNLSNIAGTAVQSYANEKAQEPIRKQEQRIRDLQLEGAESEAESRRAAGQTEQTFQQTLGSGRSRAEILKALEARPELYERASKHFQTIDDNFNRYLGSVAASVRDFDDDPEAAMVAIDDLIAQGFDEKQLDRYRQAIQQDPTNVSQLIDGLLARSPDETHRKLVTPKKAAEPFTLSQGQTRFNPDGTPMASVAEPEKPDTRSLQIQANDALKRGDTKEYQRIKKVITELADAERDPNSGSGRQGLTPNMESQVISKLARDWTAATKPARELDRQVNIMREGLKASRKGDLAQGGQAILVTFQKILDPTSVVRESEFDRSREGQSLLQRAQAGMERLTGGGPGVTMGELEKYAALAEQIAKAQRDSRLKAIQERLGRVADRYGIPRDLVFEGEMPNDTPPPPPAGGSGMPTYQDYLNSKRKPGGGG